MCTAEYCIHPDVTTCGQMRLLGTLLDTKSLAPVHDGLGAE